jgi:four helix bundle protein
MRVYQDKQFRFQDLEVWQRAAKVTSTLFAIADQLEAARNYRFAEQLRAATLSISNNIAEGSGSASKVDFANFLNTARRSVFEVANMLMILNREKLVPAEQATDLLSDLEEQSRMLLAFRKTLLK